MKRRSDFMLDIYVPMSPAGAAKYTAKGRPAGHLHGQAQLTGTTRMYGPGLVHLRVPRDTARLEDGADGELHYVVRANSVFPQMVIR